MHHGAQKSTMTGFSDLRTSLSNVASVTSATAISSKPPSLKRLRFDPLILACQWVLLRLGGATNRCPRALSPALFEAAGEDVYLHGLGELLGPASLEQAGAQSLGVRGGTPGCQAHGVDRREIPVQQPGEEPSKVGVAAPDGRDGLHLRRPGGEDTVARGQIGVALARGDARVQSS